MIQIPQRQQYQQQHQQQEEPSSESSEEESSVDTENEIHHQSSNTLCAIVKPQERKNSFDINEAMQDIEICDAMEQVDVIHANHLNEDHSDLMQSSLGAFNLSNKISSLNVFALEDIHRQESSFNRYDLSCSESRRMAEKILEMLEE